MNDRDLRLEVVSKSCLRLRDIRRWISRKPLEIEAWFHRTTNRETAYGLSNSHVTDDVTWPWKVKLVTPIRLERNISKTAGFRDYPFQRTTNRKWHRPMEYQMVTWPMTSRDPRRCFEAVLSAILATAWLLVIIIIVYHIFTLLSAFFCE